MILQSSTATEDAPSDPYQVIWDDDYYESSSWYNETNGLLKDFLDKVIQEESIFTLVDLANYLNTIKEEYQIVFFNSHFTNMFSDKKNNTLEEYNLIINKQIEILLKSYERHIKNNDYDKAAQAESIINRRIERLKELEADFNPYYELSINKIFEMLSKKDIEKYDLFELRNLIDSIIIFNNNMEKQLKDKKHLKVRN